MVITNKYLIKLCYDVLCFHWAHCADELMDFFAFPCELLPAGFPLHSEFPVLTLRTVVRETKEIKRLRLRSTFSAVFFRKTSEFNQTALFLLQFQSKVLHSVFQPFIELFCFLLILKAAYKVICIHHDPSISLLFWHYDFFEPPDQHIMHIYVGKYW